MISKERLDKILVSKGIAENTNKAKSIIMSGKILVNGKKIEKSGIRFPLSVEIRKISKKHEWVSRGGIKLSNFIRENNIDIKNKVCADIGASSGGFTDVLIRNEAEKVYCIDVGKGQLNWKLVTHEKVIVLDQMNIRYVDLEKVDTQISLITCDVSFISIRKALNKIAKLKLKNLDLITLVKPQFELSKDKIGKNGIVKDKEYRMEAVKLVKNWLSFQGWSIRCVSESTITGAKGNKEYFIHCTK